MDYPHRALRCLALPCVAMDGVGGVLPQLSVDVENQRTRSH